MARIHSLQSHGLSFDYYPLAQKRGAAFPQDHGMVVREDGHVALVNWNNGVSFTDQELPLLLTLLEFWPKMCPYEPLLSLLPPLKEEIRLEQPTEHPIERCQDKEQLALLRTILSNMQPRLEVLGLHIKAILEEGLLLLPYTPPSAGNVVSLHTKRIQGNAKS